MTFRFEGILEAVNNFKTFADVELQGCDNSEKMSFYQSCSGIITIPYTPKNFADCSEDEFFQTVMPNKGTYVFEGRGLNLSKDYSGYIAAFVNNNLIKYIAVIDDYGFVDDEKTMFINSASVIKLNVPITSNDLQVVRSGFRFIRNKQSFCDSSEILAFLEMLKSHI